MGYRHRCKNYEQRRLDSTGQYIDRTGQTTQMTPSNYCPLREHPRYSLGSICILPAYISQRPISPKSQSAGGKAFQHARSRCMFYVVRDIPERVFLLDRNASMLLRMYHLHQPCPACAMPAAPSYSTVQLSTPHNRGR